MALAGHSQQIFTQAWVDALKGTPEAAMAATIRVYSILDEVYDIDTNEYIIEEETHYLGKARVQPFRMEVQTYQPGNPTSIQNIRIQIPIDANFDVRMGMRVRVTEASLNPILEDYVFEVSGVVDSSNPFERTFNCQVDQELRDNG